MHFSILPNLHIADAREEGCQFESRGLDYTETHTGRALTKLFYAN